MNYFDAHLHIVPDSVFEQARERGVWTFICNATRPTDWQEVLDLPKRLLGVFPCIGIHPWYVNECTPDWNMRLENILQMNPLVMVGEIGLDKMRPLFEEQKRVFEIQVQLAQKYRRAIHVHCVRAWPEMLEIMAQYPDVKALYHRFMGDEFVIQKLRFLNSYFSVTNKRYVPLIPDYRLLVESDAPDGLKDGPCGIPKLVESLGLDNAYLKQNLELFLDDRTV